MSESLCCTPEPNTLKISYTPVSDIKKNKFKAGVFFRNGILSFKMTSSWSPKVGIGGLLEFQSLQPKEPWERSFIVEGTDFHNGG